MFGLFLFTLALFITLTLVVGIFAIIRNTNSRVVQLWFLLSMATVVWSGSHFMHLTAASQEQSIFYAKLLYVGAVFIPVFFYHFILQFLLIKKDLFIKSFLFFGYIFSVALSYLSMTTNLIVSGVSPKFDFPQWLDPGNLHFLLVIHFYLFAFMSVKMLLQNINKQDGVMKRKIFYILLAALVGFLAGGSNFLPQTIGWYPYGSFVAWIYMILVIYGIFVDKIKIKIN